MSRPIAFTVWLSHQRDRQDPVGDLARDVSRDRDWPIIAAKCATYERSLIRRGASETSREALNRAWAEYESDGSAAA